MANRDMAFENSMFFEVSVSFFTLILLNEWPIVPPKRLIKICSSRKNRSIANEIRTKSGTFSNKFKNSEIAYIAAIGTIPSLAPLLFYPVNKHIPYTYPKFKKV